MVYSFSTDNYNSFEELQEAIANASEKYYPTEKRPLCLYVAYRNSVDGSFYKDAVLRFEPEAIQGLFQIIQEPFNAWDYKGVVGSDVASRLVNSVAKRDMETNTLYIDKMIEVDKLILYQFGEDLSSIETGLREILQTYLPPPISQNPRHQVGFFKYALTDFGKEELTKMREFVDQPKEFFKHKPRGFVGACWIAKNLKKACSLFQLPFEEYYRMSYRGGPEKLFLEKDENLPQWNWSSFRKAEWKATTSERHERGVPCHTHALKLALEAVHHPQAKLIIGQFEQSTFGGVSTVASSKLTSFLAGFGCRLKIYKLSESTRGPVVTYNISKKVCDDEVLLEFDRFDDHLMVHYTPDPELDSWIFEKGLTKKFNILQGLRYLLDQKLIRPFNGYDIYKRLDFTSAFDQQCEFIYQNFIKSASPVVVPRDYQRIVMKKSKKFVPPLIGFFDFEASTDEDHHKPYCISYCFGGSIEKFKDDTFTIENLWQNDLDCARAFLQKVGAFWVAQGSPEFIKPGGVKLPSIVLYAHNLAYDCTFLKPFLTDRQVIEQGGKVYRIEGTYTFFIGHNPAHLRLVLQDTLCLFQASLRNVGRDYIWGNEAKKIKKEVFPYEWYTFSNFNRYQSGWAPVSVVESCFSPEQYQEFLRNLSGFDVSMYDEVSKTFNYQKYAAFYCNQDVRVLARAFYNLRQLYLGKQLENTTISGTLPFSIDILSKITASGIAYDWFLDTVVVAHNQPILDACRATPEEERQIMEEIAAKHPRMCMENRTKLVEQKLSEIYAQNVSKSGEKFIHKCNGPIRAIILEANRGGRCMTRDNKKWYYSAAKHNGVKLQDYDATSLYPSAMRRLWLSAGEIKIFRSDAKLNQDDFTQRWLRSESFDNPNHKWTDAVLHVTKLHSGRKLHFPVLCLKNPKDGLNEWRNFDHEDVDTWVNAIDLENFMDFQNGEFEWDAAIYWDQTRSPLIQQQIQALFDFRNANKDKKKNYHPIEKVAKTMMNSISGKSITKIHKTETRYLNYNQFDRKLYYPKWITENAYRVRSLEICAGNEIKAKVYCRDLGYALPIFGQGVFAMARKIIQPIFNIAEDLEEEHPALSPSVFYTDTDSLHIREDMLKLVEEKYREIYNKELAGSELGYFHIDFDPVDDHEVIGAIESYFCAKKIYIDRLLLDNGETAFHKRMKGVPNDLLKWEHYENIFNGGIQPYQLVDPRHPSFVFEEGMVKSRRYLERRIMLKEARQALIEEAALLMGAAKQLKRVAKEADDVDAAKRQKI